MNTQKTPSNAFLLCDCTPIQLSAQSGDAPRTFSGVANSGKPFLYQGKRTIVDLAGIKFKEKMPMLLDHDRACRAGVGTLSVSAAGLTVTGSLLANEHGRDIAAAADQGFPWEMSVDARPARVEQIPNGQTVTVNGQEYLGPLLVLREPTIREVSFTATGVDSETAAVVLSDDLGAANPAKSSQENANMDLQQALTENAALKAKIAELEAALEKAKNDGSAEKEGLQTQIDELKAAAHKAEVDAKLSEAGFKRDKENKQFLGVSAGTYKVLLATTSEDAAALIADLKAARPDIPGALLAETTAPEDGDGVKLADNPVVKNAQQRAKGGAHYV